MIDATSHTGRIGMVPDVAEALAAFRRFNYESIYHRAESRAQASAVIDMLRALVDAYVASPHLLPGRTDGSLEAGTAGAAHAAVAYVGGMTDRFACRQAVTLLDYPADRLPQGIDTFPTG
jgi:dGTPase